MRGTLPGVHNVVRLSWQCGWSTGATFQLGSNSFSDGGVDGRRGRQDHRVSQRGERWKDERTQEAGGVPDRTEDNTPRKTDRHALQTEVAEEYSRVLLTYVRRAQVRSACGFGVQGERWLQKILGRTKSKRRDLEASASGAERRKDSSALQTIVAGQLSVPHSM